MGTLVRSLSASTRVVRETSAPISVGTETREGVIIKDVRARQFPISVGSSVKLLREDDLKKRKKKIKKVSTRVEKSAIRGEGRRQSLQVNQISNFSWQRGK